MPIDRKRSKGFTLIEVIAVLLLIAVTTSGKAGGLIS